MIQDQQLLREFHELPPESQNELIDFLRYLKQKQKTAVCQPETSEQRQARQSRAAELLQLWQQEPPDQEELEIWDALEHEEIPPLSCGEPKLDDLQD